MRNADRRVVVQEQLAERLVDERFRLGVESAGGFVEDQDVGHFDEGACDGDALLLAA